MYDFYDYMEKDPVAEIEYVKGMYDAQVHKVEQEKYIKDLLFADYVRKVKSNASRYDYVVDLFKSAQGQIGKKKKSERRNVEILENFIREDFFDENKDFKLTNIITCGFEGYCYDVEFEFHGQTIFIGIPIMKEINIKNINHANNGMFEFGVRDSECCWSVKKQSYKIEDIAEYVKEYFSLRGDCMEVPFNLMKYKEKQLIEDTNRFIELYAKFGDNVDEILEFADLCKRFYPIKKNRYEE